MCLKIAVLDFVTKLSSEHYEDKPISLRAYEFDVLYAEAVIWGVRRIENIGYAAAEKKYSKGIGVTNEEKVRSRCIEVLNAENKKHQAQESKEKKILSDLDLDMNESLGEVNI